jgi:hypothetical protein
VQTIKIFSNYAGDFVFSALVVEIRAVENIGALSMRTSLAGVVSEM